MLKKWMQGRGKIWTIGVMVTVVVGVVLFLYYDRHSELSASLRSWGMPGVFIAVLLMAVVCVTPVPSEGVLILYMKIYGAWWGGFYSWLGAVLSSLVVFVAARHVGAPILRKLITEERFRQVDEWIKNRGTMGLLFARLLPIPGFIVSYIVGTIPSVRLWNYVWTGSVSVIPYYVGAALVFLGVSSHLVSWIGIGIGALAVFWLGGYYVKKKWIGH